MTRLRIATLLTILLSGTTVYAKNTQNRQEILRIQNKTTNYKALMINIGGESGNLIPGERTNFGLRQFENNRTTFGLNYFQNFSETPWLGIGINLDIATKIEWSYENNHITDVMRYYISEYSAAFELYISDYFFLSLDTSGLMEGRLNYLWKINEYSSVYLTTGVEFYFTGTRGIGSYGYEVSNPIAGLGSIVENFDVGFTYRYTLNNFAIETYLAIISSGDSTEDFRNNLSIRWDNTISYKINTVTLWGQLRYEPYNVINNGSLPLIHNVALNAGVIIALDFSQTKGGAQ